MADRLSILQRLRGMYLVWSGGALLPERAIVEAGAGLTATDDKINGRTVLASDGSVATFAAVKTALAGATSGVGFNGWGLTGVPSITSPSGTYIQTGAVTTTNNTPTNVPGLSIPLAANTEAINFTIQAIAKDGAGDHWFGNRIFRGYNNAGTWTAESSGTLLADFGPGGFGVAPVISGGNLVFQATGAPSTTVYWSVTVTATKV